MSTLSDVKAIVTARSPDTVQDSRFDTLVTLASSQVYEQVFGDQYAYAVAMVVLHWYELESRGNSVGAVQSEKEGQLSRTYKISGDDDYWLSSAWGAEFLRIRKTLVFAVRNRMFNVR